MELEQLVGSNSFGSAMKQPFLLRRLDVLTLALFLIWCLSPLGTQGLQRSYNKIPNVSTNDTTVHYLDMTGNNPLWSYNAQSSSDTNRTAQIQLVSVYYMAAFLPVSERDVVDQKVFQDRYDNPGIPLPNIPPQYVNTLLASAYGVPIILPNPTFNISIGEDDNEAKRVNDERSDQVIFNMTASYYNLTCSPWVQKTYEDISTDLNMSYSGELGITMTDTSTARPNFVAFASHNRPANPANNTAARGDWQYSYIECTYERVLADITVDCWRVASTNMLPACITTFENTTRTEPPADPQEPYLDDFSEAWVMGTNPSSDNFVTSMSKFCTYSLSLLHDST
jgi:hypothetical protein